MHSIFKKSKNRIQLICISDAIFVTKADRRIGHVLRFTDRLLTRPHGLVSINGHFHSGQSKDSAVTCATSLAFHWTSSAIPL